MKRYDAIVLGLGAAGSAALYHLAKRHRDVLGIDRFSPPHANGSSHGDTRITRAAIGEGAGYTPLALRSHELWRTLERETGDELFTANGGLIISSSTTAATTHVADFFANTVAAATQYGIAHELLDALEIRRRFPPFRVGDDEIGYYEPGAGFVRPERCIRAHLAVARERGAQIRCDETVAAFESNNERVVVATDRARYEARVLIIAAGPWLPTLVDPALARLFRIYRQTLAWYDVDGPIERFLPASFPIFIWELPRGRRGVYGFPAIDGPHGGVKIGVEAFDATTRADACDRAVDAAEIAAMHRDCVAPYLAALSNRCIRTTTCLYTVTPDFGFVVDAHPQSDRVLIASPCSGHGFKHSPALGEALAQWAIEGEKPALLDAFAWSRTSLAVD